MYATKTRRPITDKQAAFITRLRAERNLPQTDTSALTSAAASHLIDTLLASKPAAPAAPQREAAPGYYITGEDLYVVVENKTRTHTYAKHLDIRTGPTGRHTAAWVYAPGTGRALADSHPLTVAEAASLGHKYGFCVICCRPLTDPASVDRGIGPVCAKRLIG